MLGKAARVLGWTLLTLMAFAIGALVTLRLLAVQRETRTVAELAPASGRHVATSLGRIFVAQSGPESGRHVMLVHGTAAWSGFWREVADHLAREGFRVTAIDLPPFGFSDRSAEARYSRADQAARISELLAGIGAQRALIVGHSFGGGPVLETAMRHPARVGGVVLVSAALAIQDKEGVDEPPPGWLTSTLGVTWLRDTLVAAIVTNPALTGTLVRTLLHRKDAVTPEIVATLQQPMALAGTTPAFGAWLPGFLAPDASALSRRPSSFAALRMPVAIIWGSEDQVTPMEQARRLAGLLPHASLDVLEGVGHIPHIEAPDAFKPLLVKQLRRLAEQTGG
jgi:pimeloyl-ACP methyl ester carboxylesterase